MKMFIFRIDDTLLREFDKIREEKFYGVSKQKLMNKILKEWIVYYANKKF